MSEKSSKKFVTQLKTIGHQISRKMGYDFRRYTYENFPELKRIKVINSQKIDLILDIGASEGFYGIELRETGYKGQIISFEPLTESFESLKKRANKDPKWSCFNTALGEKDDEVEMSVSGHITSSSLLPMTEAHLNALQTSATVSKEKIKVRTLNSFLGEDIRGNERIYLKVDVQGFEMFVLKGANMILPQVEAIEMELSLTTLYQGAPLFVEMITYLQSLGFMVVSLNHVFSDTNSDQLLQVDGIFKKKH